MSDWAERLAELHHRRAGSIIVAGLILAALSLPVILGVPGLSDGLTLNSDFTAMLPEHAQSVRDLDEIQRRFGGQQAMTLAIEADDEEGLHRFVRDFAARIETLEDEKVVAVDWNISDFARFVEDNRLLYADARDLRAIRDALRGRLDRERARANPFFLDLEEEEGPDPETVIRRIENQARQKRAEVDRRFPGGFLQHPRRTLVLMVVHTSIRGGATGDTDRLLAAVRREADRLHPDRYSPHVRIYWGGTLVEIREETDSLVAAVRDATLLTIGLVMLAIYVFFLRVRPIPLLMLGILPPVLMTFAFAELTVDYLNASSAFLAAIVVGNGINPHIVWLARYFEERRGGADVRSALVTSHRGTWKGTLTASLAASVAYGSLMSTDYRGFRDFGIVGGTGMVLCWIAAYLLLPALAVQFERWRPLTFKHGKTYKGYYGMLFSRIALGSPKLVLGLSLLVTVVSGALVAWALIKDPMEYDWRRLRSNRDPRSDSEQIQRFSRAILTETMTGSALAILAPSRRDAQRFERELESPDARHRAEYGEVRSIDDILPPDQEQKIRLLRELRQLMLQVRPHVDARMQHLIDEELPSQRIEPLGPDDLPRSVARPYTERDGTRGRLLAIEHNPRESSWDGLYLARWAGAARSLRTERSDRPPPVAGTAVVFSDLMTTIWRDGPRAVAVAFLATVLLLLLTFREQRERWITLVSLLVGVLWMAAGMAVLGMRLNFLNFVAFPITFGNGVDYAVNIVRRYADEVEGGVGRVKAVRAAVEGTGGAVILCSLTTTIGYISIHTSNSQALNSFGAATALGEVTCLGAAVLALPAALHLLGRREAKTRAPSRDVRASQV